MSSALNSISPIDGRYQSATQSLQAYFSEAALIRYRVKMEIAYLMDLSTVIPNVDFTALHKQKDTLILWADSLDEASLERVKTIEKTTNHDVKAVEYLIKEKLDSMGLEVYKEWVHFGLTSQDVNNTSIPWSMKDANVDVLQPALTALIEQLYQQAKAWENQPMLAKTHGQPASPTKLGKEWMVFVRRLQGQMEALTQIPFSAKFGGATGNFNAHHVAYPSIPWIDFADNFVNKTLGLHRISFTTQIEPYDHLAAHLDNWKRINTILLDFCRDVWTYVSMEYFKQKIKEGEVGSSAMPHKVNPIDFENAEGNLGIANALFEHLSSKLPVSRLQRDLTDSTVLRNLGVPFGHTVIAIKSIQRGLNKLLLNEGALHADLENNWAVVAEAIQTILRREGYPNAYEALKGLTRTNSKITQETIQEFIAELEVSEAIKSEMLQITPYTYTGISPKY